MLLSHTSLFLLVVIRIKHRLDDKSEFAAIHGRGPVSDELDSRYICKCVYSNTVYISSNWDPHSPAKMLRESIYTSIFIYTYTRNMIHIYRKTGTCSTWYYHFTVCRRYTRLIAHFVHRSPSFDPHKNEQPIVSCYGTCATATPGHQGTCISRNV
jgi:hypothetical protein